MDCKTYNCAGSAFQTYRVEEFGEVWNTEEINRAYRVCEDRVERRDYIAANLAAFVASRFKLAYKAVNRSDDLPVGTVLLRIYNSAFLGADFHFIRKVDFDGETCWLSKPGLLPEDILFDDDVIAAAWPGGYDSQMYAFYPA